MTTATARSTTLVDDMSKSVARARAGPGPGPGGGVRVELGGRDLGRDGAQRRTGRVYRRGPRRLWGDP
jgi:hypothetical protein